MSLLIVDPIFNIVMSREGKQLRDEVLNMCLQHGTAGQANTTSYTQQIIATYSPLSFERAVLYAGSRSVLEAVCRRTSSAFYRHKDKPGMQKPEWQKGSTDGNRYKKIDWLSVAAFGPEWWINSIQFPRSGAIQPQNFDKVRDEFVNIYSLFTSWLLIDFSFKALYSIWDLTNRFSPEFIKKCMDLVEDKSKRSIEYLSPIIDKEWAIMRSDMMERKELNEQSKAILVAISGIVADRSKPVNWDPIDKDREVDAANSEVFNKVKLS
jgi:hypothetical protein